MDEILVVDDSLINQIALRGILEDEFDIVCASSGKEMFKILEKVSPKLIILDIIMPEWDGFQVIEKLKASEEYQKIPVIFITGLNDAKSEEKGFQLGAIDYIAKPFKENVVKARVRSYIQLYDFIKSAEDLSKKDGLSGLYNKKTTEELIIKNLTKVDNGALMVIDVDNFKSINDTFGHLYGDMVIKQLASVLRSIFQKSDILGRVGGDEFFVFLRNYNDKGVLDARANDICREFRKTYEHNGQSVSISSSIGIATTDDSLDFEELYKKADVALYETKANGKNGFTFFSGSEEIAYKSTRTTIETSKGASADVSTGIKNLTYELNEYVFNLAEENKVADYTIQSLLSILCEQFGFKKGYIAKFNYEDRIIKCIYNWKCSEDGIDPLTQEISLETITNMFEVFESENFYLSNPNDHRFEFNIDQDPNNTICAFALKNKTVLLGYIGFERSPDAEPLNQRHLENVISVCQQLSTIVVYQFLIETATNAKDDMIKILDNLAEPIYIARPDRVKPLYINDVAKNLKLKTHGASCYKKTREGTTSCEDCPMKKAIANRDFYEDDTYWCKGIKWSNGSRAYIIKMKKY